MLLGFLPFAVASVIHLVTLFAGWDDASTITKLTLMPALLVGLALALPRRRGLIAVLTALAILFSWAGDALLETPGEIGFLLGLCSFLVAHVAYLTLFAVPLRRRRVPWFALVYAAWWLALVGVIAPYVGALLMPVAAYGLVIALAAAAALGVSRLAAVGALLFLVSDTLLAFRLFYPGFEFWQMNLTIMLFYVLGQGLIVLGVVRLARGAAAAAGPESAASAASPESTAPSTPLS